jgi:glycosyltransferase involved in cell wall biosynthesis
VLPRDFTLLQVTPELDTGGVERTTVDVARAVVRCGGTALVASRGGRLEGELAEAGAELIRLPVHSKNLWTVTANGGALERVVRERNVFLIHVRSRAPAFSALAASRRTGVPLIATYAGVYSATGPVKRWYNAVMTRGARVIANSEFTREHVIAEHRVDPAKVVAIPRGIDLERFDPAAVSPERVARLRAAWGLSPDERRLVVLLAGRLTRWKGQTLLIDALAELKRGGRADVLAVLAGDDQGRDGYRAELQARIAAADLDSAVRIVGHTEDMPAAYLAADLAAVPSLSPEAFGRTAVEPQTMGRPVLAADHGAPRETVIDGETGWRVPPGDARGWAEALARAADAGPQRLAAMGEAGRARARRLYSVDAMCEATLQVYAEVLADLRSGGLRGRDRQVSGRSTVIASGDSAQP